MTMAGSPDTPGKICYQTYRDARNAIALDGKEIPSWDANDNEDIKSAWEAAARAVLRRAESGPFNEG